MKHFIICIKFDRWFVPGNLAGKIIDEFVEYVVVDLADGDWDKLIDGESDKAVRGVPKDILHIV